MKDRIFIIKISEKKPLKNTKNTHTRKTQMCKFNYNIRTNLLFVNKNKGLSKLIGNKGKTRETNLSQPY